MAGFRGTTPQRCALVSGVVRLALEWDRGTEAFEVIADKALRYRTLTEVGIYQRLFGGPVLPVLIAPTHLRAAELVQAWNAPHAWPGGIGVVAVSTPRRRGR